MSLKPNPAKLPTYPIMSLVHDVPEDDLLTIRCCCGHLYEVERDVAMRQCSNCYGIPGMSAERHLSVLSRIQLSMDACAMSFAGGDDVAFGGWVVIVQQHLLRLAANAVGLMELMTSKQPTSAELKMTLPETPIFSCLFDNGPISGFEKAAWDRFSIDQQKLESTHGVV